MTKLVLLGLFSFLSLVYSQSHGKNALIDNEEQEIEQRIRKEEASCKDTDWSSCEYFMRWRLCYTYRHSLRRRCRKSCKLCGEEDCALTRYGCCWDMKTPARGPNGEGCQRNCHNRLGKHKCTMLKINGGCIKNQELMYEMCRGVCFCDWKMKPEIPKCTKSRNGCCWDGYSFASKNLDSCPVCRDIYSKRICTLFRPLCTRYGYPSGWEMRKACSKTCGICDFFKRNNLENYSKDLTEQIRLLKSL